MSFEKDPNSNPSSHVVDAAFYRGALTTASRITDRKAQIRFLEIIGVRDMRELRRLATEEAGPDRQAVEDAARAKNPLHPLPPYGQTLT